MASKVRQSHSPGHALAEPHIVCAGAAKAMDLYKAAFNAVETTAACRAPTAG